MLTEDLMTLLAAQTGVVSRRGVLGAGGTDNDVERLLRRCRWARSHLGRPRRPTGPPTWSQRAWAACLRRTPPPRSPDAPPCAPTSCPGFPGRTASVVGAVTAYRDVRYREHGVLVELDGRPGRDRPTGRWGDLERDLGTPVQGEVTIRVG